MCKGSNSCMSAAQQRKCTSGTCAPYRSAAPARATYMAKRTRSHTPQASPIKPPPVTTMPLSVCATPPRLAPLHGRRPACDSPAEKTPSACGKTASLARTVPSLDAATTASMDAIKTRGFAAHDVDDALRRAGIVGRREELQQLVAFLASRLHGGVSGAVYVSGSPGTGKTAVVVSLLPCLCPAWAYLRCCVDFG